MPYQATEATEATRARRKQTLLAAATAVVAQHGFQLATVKSVAAIADMSVGSVYLFFPTKVELLAAVFRRAADVELAAVRTAVHDARAAADVPPQTAAAELSALVLCFAQRAIRGRQLAWSLLLEPVDRAIDVERLEYRKSYADLMADILARGIRSGELAPQNPELSGAALVGAISEALTGPLSPLHAIGTDTAPADTGSADTAPADTDSTDPDPTGSAHTDEVIAAITALCLRAVGASEPVALLTGKATL